MKYLNGIVLFLLGVSISFLYWNIHENKEAQQREKEIYINQIYIEVTRLSSNLEDLVKMSGNLEETKFQANNSLSRLTRLMEDGGYFVDVALGSDLTLVDLPSYILGEENSDLYVGFIQVLKKIENELLPPGSSEVKTDFTIEELNGLLSEINRFKEESLNR